MRVSRQSVALFSLLLLFVSSPPSGAKEDKAPAVDQQVKITDASFGCISDMEKVRDMYMSGVLPAILQAPSRRPSRKTGKHIRRAVLCSSCPVRQW